tara:strand:+ start:354158 stop:355207 length:1050 start_codon:yes stop_codon:yes gene_type:complete
MNKVIVAPLNWGLGHATRCIPIINKLLENKFTPVIASDGDALLLLRKEFPKLTYFELPGYNIRYARNLKFNLLLQLPKVIKAVKKERKIIDAYVANNKVVGIISDNRFGVRSAKVPSVYITHQVNVLSNKATALTSKGHQLIIKKFDECWIPDSDKQPNLSGRLSDVKNTKFKTRFIGVLSRFEKQQIPSENNLLVLLSGPEPQRSLLETKLVHELKDYRGKLVIVQGKLEKEQHVSHQGNRTVYNFLLSEELEAMINKSDLVLCRSGYSSIMDLATLSKKAFFIPTPNQTEQEYLATHLEAQQLAPYTHQNDFNLEMLKEADNYKGMKSAEVAFDVQLFDLFNGKRKS